jgi:hypothetical protein
MAGLDPDEVGPVVAVVVPVHPLVADGAGERLEPDPAQRRALD